MDLFSRSNRYQSPGQQPQYTPTGYTSNDVGQSSLKLADYLKRLKAFEDAQRWEAANQPTDYSSMGLEAYQMQTPETLPGLMAMATQKEQPRQIVGQPYTNQYLQSLMSMIS